MGYNPEVSSEEFAIDLTGVGNGKAKSYTIPEGDYTVILTDLEKGTSNNNNPQWIWTFEVGNGPHVGVLPKDVDSNHCCRHLED